MIFSMPAAIVLLHENKSGYNLNDKQPNVHYRSVKQQNLPQPLPK